MNNSESPISINEHLSALLDDETGSFEERRVLDELKTDEKLSQKLATYALIGETIRTGDGEKPVLSLGSAFLDGIHKQIELEDEFNEVVIADSDVKTNQVAQSENKPTPLPWLRPVGGFAVAASVGALAFMGLQNIGLLSSPNSQPSNFVDSSAPTAIVDSTPVTIKSPETAVDTSIVVNDQYANADAETRAMLKRYVDSHMQYAATSAFVPAVRVIAYTDNQ